ncbi:MAG: amidase, partial [Chloroflexi bacterium]|nr:amidase [Chloroflexota bacterium]
MDKQLVFLPVRQLSELVRTRRVSPVELAEGFLERLEELGPRYNAVVTVTRERAMRQARHAEAEIRARVYRGPLHGIPYGAKDLLATSEGIPTTWGAAPFRQQTFEEDATVVRRLEEAGAVLAAKLSMVELAGGMGYRQPNASFTGPGITPWGANAWSGGSSSGSGASVAAGLVPFAIGSETWGSILSPANNCGVAGLRPTYGRVSRHGAMALSWTLDKLGPLGLTADDCGLVLEAIAGYDAKDPSTAQRSFRYDVPTGRVAPGRRFRLGVLKAVT